MFRYAKTSIDVIFSIFLISICCITHQIPSHTIIAFVQNFGWDFILQSISLSLGTKKVKLAFFNFS